MKRRAAIHQRLAQMRCSLVWVSDATLMSRNSLRQCHRPMLGTDTTKTASGAGKHWGMLRINKHVLSVPEHVLRADLGAPPRQMELEFVTCSLAPSTPVL